MVGERPRALPQVRERSSARAPFRIRAPCPAAVRRLAAFPVVFRAGRPRAALPVPTWARHFSLSGLGPGSGPAELLPARPGRTACLLPAASRARRASRRFPAWSTSGCPGGGSDGPQAEPPVPARASGPPVG